MELPEPRCATFLKEISRPGHVETKEEEEIWFHDNTPKLMNLLDQHGALHFTGFGLSRDAAGFRSLCDALSPTLHACEDALASIGVRSLLSAADGVYQAVDATRLADTYIGLHNDCTFKLAPPYAAFCCFQKATAGGGEFILADGRQVLRTLRPDVLEPMMQKQLRVRVASIATPCLKNNNNNSPWTDLATAAVESIATWGLGTFLPRLQLEWAWSKEKDTLQILEPLKSPVNGHPKSGIPTFFSGIHSQSAYLQAKRAAEAFSGVATTDVFYRGKNDKETSEIEAEVLDHIETVMSECAIKVLMEPGDVVLLDSYQVLHGRDTFRGEREHAVIWLADT